MIRPFHLLSTVFRAIAFWAAVVLPLAYVPPLLGLSPTEPLLAVTAIHACCLVVGHEHTPRSRFEFPVRS